MTQQAKRNLAVRKQVCPHRAVHSIRELVDKCMLLKISSGNKTHGAFNENKRKEPDPEEGCSISRKLVN